MQCSPLAPGRIHHYQMNYVPSKDMFKSQQVSVTAHLWKTESSVMTQVKGRLLGWACTNTSGTLTNEEEETANRERQPQAEGHPEWLAAQEAGRAKEDMCPRVSEESPTCSPIHRHMHCGSGRLVSGISLHASVASIKPSPWSVLAAPREIQWSLLIARIPETW